MLTAALIYTALLGLALTFNYCASVLNQRYDDERKIMLGGRLNIRELGITQAK